MPSIEYGLPGGETELEVLSGILSTCFGYPPEMFQKRFPVVGHDHIRVVRSGGKVAGGLWLVPMGQYFGGKSVPMTGVACVGIAPEYRGSGLARVLMDRTVRGMQEEGVPLSTLYPATQTLYRRSGYDQAGYRIRCSLKPSDIGIHSKEGSLRKATEEDQASVQALYASMAPDRPGHLQRVSYIWDRVFAFRDQKADGYLVEEGGRLTGYVYMVQNPLPEFGYELLVTDLVAVTPTAARRLLSLLSDHRSLAGDIKWHTSPANPVLAQLSEQPFRFGSQMIWTTRMVDVEKALAARGYTPGLSGEVHLAVDDDIVPANQARFLLRVEDGEPSVERGGRGDLKTDVRGLVSLYSGFLSPVALAGMGLLEGPQKELRAAGALFSGPTPWMPDMF